MSDIVVEKKDHSKFGASGSYIWLNCPGSHQLREKLQLKNRAGLAANEGTAAHEVCSTALIKQMDSFEFLGQTIEVGPHKFTVSAEMIEAVEVYLDFVRSKLTQYPGAILRVEHPMASVLDDDAFGTGDLVIYVPGDRIIVVDYKHGRGVVVEPSTTQLREYGYLAYETRPEEMHGAGEPKVIELWVVQPRIPHHLGPCRKYITNPAEVTTWFMETAIPAMNAARQPDAPLKVGPWCQWCPVLTSNNCPAQITEARELKVDKEPVQLSGEELGILIEKLNGFKALLGVLEKEAYERKMRGEFVRGFKLVNKKANRVFKDGASEMAELIFGEDAYDPKTLKSPAGIEKLAEGKKFVAQWAYTPVTGLTIAPMTDTRREVKPPMEAFTDSLPVPENVLV